jgi:hypothetical protein
VVQAHFSAERVAEGIQVDKKVILAYDALQRPDQGRDEQSHDPPVESVRKSRAVSLAEVETEIRVGYRVAKPRE